MLAPSERVKALDLHPREPWMLVATHHGNITIWNYETETAVKQIEVTRGAPIRAAKFIPRQNWLICG
ncbi:MAG: hypothetical protein MHM6MM_007890, partial [Cercozoa sp. M6MM]